MKNLLFTLLILICFGCESKQENTAQFESLAELIIEINDKEQLKSFSDKLQKFKENPASVFKDGSYYYDTEDSNNEAYRGTSEDLKKNIQWFLLIDNLSKGEYICEFDWKEASEDIKWALSKLAEQKNYALPELPKIKNDDEKDASEILGIINETLNKSGFTLINLYIDSDSYVTALIKKENLKNIIAKASKSGNEITEYKKD